ncbi:transmembrane ascorbate-dependent reductase CYB561-like [Watersipora subatra]|uniref:transmembrane ascorbate-dependent reductase CYB561-like n=1 Tax=Watersipora subatra TaxID=2589382 RepID=UPI00355B746E
MEVWRKFIVLGILSQIVGILAVILMGVWMGYYLGGFGWGYKNKLKFNYHPLLVTVGLIFIYGDAILVYRIFRKEKKLYIKILHMVLQLAAFTITVIGVKAVFSTHSDEDAANLYSIHGWLGILTIILFGLQFVMGFIFYLLPAMSEPLKAWYMSSHRYWGVAIFVMAITTALVGTMEEVGFKIRDYSSRPAQAYVVNFMAMSLVVFGWLVTYLVTKPEYKRDDNAYTSTLEEAR